METILICHRGGQTTSRRQGIPRDRLAFFDLHQEVLGQALTRSVMTAPSGKLSSLSSAAS
jgi:hypothetical protein